MTQRTPAKDFNPNDIQRQQAIAAMNAAHACMAKNDPKENSIAHKLYSKAIDLLTPIANNSANANSLGAALMNRGQLIHATKGPSDKAICDFNRATEILSEHLDDPNPWIRRNYCGTLLNLSNLLLDLNKPIEARNRAASALAASELLEKTEATNLQIELYSRRAYCDAIGQILPYALPEELDNIVGKTREHVDQGLALIRSLRKPEEPEPFAEISQRLFQFGANLIAHYDPQHLEAFLRDHLRTLADASQRKGFNKAIHDSICIAVNTLSKSLSLPTTDLDQQDELLSQAKSLQNFHGSIFPIQ